MAVDNAPGDAPERVVRIGSDGRSTVVELDGKRAPSSLAVLPDGSLVTTTADAVWRDPDPA